MGRWLCSCGAVNAAGLMACPRCKALSPRFAYLAAQQAPPQPQQPATPKPRPRHAAGSRR